MRKLCQAFQINLSDRAILRVMYNIYVYPMLQKYDNDAKIIHVLPKVLYDAPNQTYGVKSRNTMIVHARKNLRFCLLN